MAWTSKKLTFAQVVSKKANGEDKDLQKYMRGAKESELQYVTRIKKIVQLSKSILTEFPVYELTKGSRLIKIAARNSTVAKVLATQQHQTSTRPNNLSEEIFVSRVLSDPNQAYDIGIDDNMDLDEADSYARDYYQASYVPKKISVYDFSWLSSKSRKIPDTTHHKEGIFA